MTNDARLEIRLPSRHRLKIDQLSEETGLSAGVLVHLALMRLVQHDRHSLLDLIGKDLET
jgi:hypothetical protein